MGPNENHQPDADPADEHLSFLSVSEANEIRVLVRHAFAEQGIEVVVHADRVTAQDGREFGLWNVAAVCHQNEDGRPAWPMVAGVRPAIAHDHGWPGPVRRSHGR